MIIDVSCPICGTHNQLNTSSYDSLEKGICCGTGGLVTAKQRDIILKDCKSFWDKVYDPKESQIQSPLAKPELIDIRRENRNIFCLSDRNKPSQSMKDRASSIAIWDAIQSNKKSIAVASCGNAALSTAKLSKKVGIECTVFIPKHGTHEIQKRLEHEKAKIILFDSYAEAVNACKEYFSESKESYCRLTGINPLTRVGKSTIFDKLKLIKDKDFTLHIPVGDGNLASGLFYHDIERFKINLYSPKLAQNRAFTNTTPEKTVSSILPLDVSNPQDYSLIKELGQRANITLITLEEKNFKREGQIIDNRLNRACEVFFGGLFLAEHTNNGGNSIIFHTGTKWN